MTQTKIGTERAFPAIAVYNVTEKVCVGVFRGNAAVYVRNKTRTHNSVLGFIVCLRSASAEQITLLDKNEFWILPPHDTPELLLRLKGYLGKSYGDTKAENSRPACPSYVTNKRFKEKIPALRLTHSRAEVAKMLGTTVVTVERHYPTPLIEKLQGFTTEELRAEISRREK